MPSQNSRYPGPALRTAAGYGWRFLVIAGSGYVLLKILSPLYTLIVAVVVALILTAALNPVLAFLRRRHIPRGPATIVTVLFAIVVVGGIVFLVVDRAIAGFPALGHQIARIVPVVRHWLIHGPLHINASTLNHLNGLVSREVSRHGGTIASSALSIGTTVAGVLAGTVLVLFVTIFLLYDGEGVWEFLVRLFPAAARPRVDLTGRSVWRTLSMYIRGTLIVAVYHGAAVAIALAALGVPLVAPLGLIVGLGAFVPLVGAIIAGAVAVAVAGLTQGLLAALVILLVLIANSQIEGHLLQPFVVGRYVHIHPLATVLALAAGELWLGIFGAIIAVPVAASINAGARALASDEPPTDLVGDRPLIGTYPYAAGRPPPEPSGSGGARGARRLGLGAKPMDPAKTDSDLRKPASSQEARLAEQDHRRAAQSAPPPAEEAESASDAERDGG